MRICSLLEPYWCELSVWFREILTRYEFLLDLVIDRSFQLLYYCRSHRMMTTICLMHFAWAHFVASSIIIVNQMFMLLLRKIMKELRLLQLLYKKDHRYINFSWISRKLFIKDIYYVFCLSLFISYVGKSYLSCSKEERQAYLDDGFNFSCKCLPCSENWSDICVPSIQVEWFKKRSQLRIIRRYNCYILFSSGFVWFDAWTLFGNTLREDWIQGIDVSQVSRKIRIESRINGSAADLLERMARDLTTQLKEYKLFQEYMRMIFEEYFGEFTFDISNKCSLFHQR